MKYGIDTYSRYIEIDGEKFAVEPLPRFYGLAPIQRFKARFEILKWHIGIIKQHGLKEWWRLRKY